MTTHRAVARLTPLAALASVLFLVAACVPYVNVPAQRGDMALHQPTYDTVTHIAAAAISAVVADRPQTGRYIVQLPQGVNTGQYDVVIASLGENAVALPKADDMSLPLLDARRVRVRGWHAQVDVVRPMEAANPHGQKQLVTVDLKRDIIEGWHVTHIRPWHLDVEEALRVAAEAERPYTDRD